MKTNLKVTEIQAKQALSKPACEEVIICGQKIILKPLSINGWFDFYDAMDECIVYLLANSPNFDLKQPQPEEIIKIFRQLKEPILHYVSILTKIDIEIIKEDFMPSELSNLIVAMYKLNEVELRLMIANFTKMPVKVNNILELAKKATEFTHQLQKQSNLSQPNIPTGDQNIS